MLNRSFEMESKKLRLDIKIIFFTLDYLIYTARGQK